MEDREFFDHILQIWARTTGAENMYWMPEPDGGEDADPYSLQNIYAVNEKQEKKLVASLLSNEDADFITAVHGCFGDLIRQLIDSMDEADRLDEEKDDLIVRIAELEMEVDGLESRLEELEDDVLSAHEYADEKLRENDDLLSEIASLEEELSAALSGDDE